jgi:4-amino-4-deoxy-L-arabinose transferase-like glycosyltransferase
VNRRHAVNAALLLWGLVLFGWKLGGHALWPPDEPRFALVAKEMRARADAIVLSRNDRLYTDKPPLFFWAIAAASLLTGRVDETAARLPSLMGALGSLLLVVRLGERLYDRRTGLLGAVAFGTSVQILERARWASIDMTLCFFTLGAIVLFFEAADRDDGAGERGGWAVPLAWASMGLGTLAKGPVALVMPLLAVVPGFFLLGRGRDLRRLFRPVSMLLYVAVVLAWFGPFCARLGVGEALHIATHQTVERYVNAWNAQQPVWYYLWRFPAGFLPWIVCLPAAVAAGLKRDPTVAPERPPGPERERRAAILLAAWGAAILLFFSFSTGKRGVYIIPMYPAAALLVARLFTRPGAERRAAAASRLLGLALVPAGLAVALLVPRRHADMRPLAFVVAGLFIAAGLVVLALSRRRPEAIPWAVGVAMTVLMLFVSEAVFPAIDRHLNISGFAHAIAPLLAPERPLGTTEEKREAWVFYLGRPVEELDTGDAVVAWMSEAPGRDLVIEDEALRALLARLPQDAAVASTGLVSGRPYHLLRRP